MPLGALVIYQEVYLSILFGLVKTVSILSALSIFDDRSSKSFCHTGLQDHFHGLLCTCKCSCVDGKMAKLVLLAQLRSTFYLWQTGEWMERKTNRDHPLSETKLHRAGCQFNSQQHNLLCTDGQMQIHTYDWMNIWDRKSRTYQHAESLTVIDRAG